MSSRIENDENVNPTSVNLAIYHEAQRFSTTLMHEDNSDDSGFDYLSSKRDLFSFDRLNSHEDVQVDEYQNQPNVGLLSEKSQFAPRNTEMRAEKTSVDILKERNEDTPETSGHKFESSEICKKKIAIKKFARKRVDPNENFLSKQTAKNEDFKNLKKWLEIVFKSIEACLESKKQQIENNANMSQKEYNSKKRAQEKRRRGVMKEIREIKKLHSKKLETPESLRERATELLMRVNEREMRKPEGFYINTMPRIPDTEYALINTSQHFLNAIW